MPVDKKPFFLSTGIKRSDRCGETKALHLSATHHELAGKKRTMNWDHVHTKQGGVEAFNPRYHAYPCRNPDCDLNGAPRLGSCPTCGQPWNGIVLGDGGLQD